MSYQVDEIILVGLCLLPFVLVGAAAVYLLVVGDLCDTGEEVGE